MGWWDLSHFLKWVEIALFLWRTWGRVWRGWGGWVGVRRRSNFFSKYFNLREEQFDTLYITCAPNVVEAILPRSGRTHHLLHWIILFKEAIHHSNHFAISRNSKFSLSCVPAWQTNSGMQQTKKSKMPLEHLVQWEKLQKTENGRLQPRLFFPAHSSLETFGKPCVFRRSQGWWTVIF